MKSLAKSENEQVFSLYELCSATGFSPQVVRKMIRNGDIADVTRCNHLYLFTARQFSAAAGILKARAPKKACNTLHRQALARKLADDAPLPE